MLWLSVSLACEDARAGRARTLFVLGDSYAVASARYMLPIAQSVHCDAQLLNITRNGWTAEEILEAKQTWLPKLLQAPQPVVVYLSVGFNDMLLPGRKKSPQAAAVIVNELLDFLNATVAADGGHIVHVGYDDIWSLPDHPVYFAGKPSSLRRELTPMFAQLYEGFRLEPANETEARGAARYRFVDVRGWLGDALWTNDGIHMTHENYDAQARLLWNEEFHELLGCDPVVLDGSTW
jgi:lysophospholipase L1-like esterase